MITRILVAAIRLYRASISPFLGGLCRYEPTCSRYTEEALRRHGAGRGLFLGVRRILRCHPWATGGYDPVPPSPGAPGREAVAGAVPVSPANLAAGSTEPPRS